MQAIFLVDKKILSLSSAILKSMLAFGRDSEAGQLTTLPEFSLVLPKKEKARSEITQGQAKPHLDLPRLTVKHDNSQAMQIILHVIHLQGHRVPEDVSHVLFYELAVLCDKYELRRALGTWPCTWAQPSMFDSRSPVWRNVFTTFVFELEAEFCDITREIIDFDLIKNSNGSIEVGDQFLETKIPAKLKGELFDTKKYGL